MAIQVTTITTAIHIDDPVPPSMLVSTLALIRKSDKSPAFINPNEWNAPGSLYTSELYDISAAKTVVPELSLPTAQVVPYTAHELSLLDTKALRAIMQNMGIEIERTADKQAIVSAIIAKQG
jgi:hypothetical protein